MTADEIRASVSLSHKRSQPGLMEHSRQEQGSVCARSSESVASMYSPLCSKVAAEAPAFMFVLNAIEGQKGHLSQMNGLPLYAAF